MKNLINFYLMKVFTLWRKMFGTLDYDYHIENEDDKFDIAINNNPNY